MRLWPRSLLWRTVVLLAVLLVVAQVAAVAVLQLSLAAPRLARITQQVASMVNLTRAALVTSQPGKRRALLEELARRERIRVYPAEQRRPARMVAARPAFRRLQGALRKELGEGTRLGLDPASGGSLWVSFDIGEHRYWLVLPRARIDQRPFPWRWVGWIGVVLALAVAGAWFIVSRLSRPLERLGEAAARIGRGEDPPPVPERGPAELRALAGSFNRMAADLAQLEADRRLLLAGVSHDLRTPLARLRLQAEMLTGNGADAARQGMVRDIEDMDAIIGQFLDFVAQGNGEAAEAMDLDRLVRDTAQRYAGLGHPVSASTGGLPPMTLRPTAMQRLLSNLLDNALEHGQPPQQAQAAVEVRTWVQAGYAYLSVLDRGPGIEAGNAERLIQPFTRMDPDRAGSGGTGLGLAIVDRIARAHGGTLELLMRSGGGLEARVALGQV